MVNEMRWSLLPVEQASHLLHGKYWELTAID